MVRLSKESKTRLEEAVYRCASIFHDSQSTLCRLHVSRPDHFAMFVAKYIPVNGSLNEHLMGDDFWSHSTEDRERLVRLTIGRLVRKHRLRPSKLSVPFLLGRGTPNRRIEQRDMTCYWPSTVLDKMASV